jgi:hypothetical protein
LTARALELLDSYWYFNLTQRILDTNILDTHIELLDRRRRRLNPVNVGRVLVLKNPTITHIANLSDRNGSG